MASSPFTLHISATSSLLELLFHPIIVASLPPLIERIMKLLEIHPSEEVRF